MLDDLKTGEAVTAVDVEVGHPSRDRSFVSGRWLPVLFFSWGLLLLWLAGRQSFFGDELNPLQQSYAALPDALRSLFSEPSPFAPGPTVYFYISRILFSAFLPEEVWSRSSSVAFALMTLWMCFDLTKNAALPMRTLPWLVLGSPAVTLFALQMRPYSALIFGGFLAAALVVRSKEVSGKWVLLGIFSTHLFGICFISIACAVKRRWRLAATAAAYLAMILAQFTIHVEFPTEVPSFSQIISRTISFEPNHLTGTLWMLLMTTVGAVVLQKRAPRTCAALLVVLLSTVLIPIFSIWKAGYFFAPRQLIGGMAGALVLCSIGVDALSRWTQEKWGRPWLKRAIFTISLVILAIYPWSYTVVMNRGPFIALPLLRYHEVARELSAMPEFHAWVIDPFQWGPLRHYLARDIGMASERKELPGLGYSTECWGGSRCVSIVLKEDYCNNLNDLLCAAKLRPLMKDDRNILLVSHRISLGNYMPNVRILSMLRKGLF